MSNEIVVKVVRTAVGISLVLVSAGILFWYFFKGEDLERAERKTPEFEQVDPPGSVIEDAEITAICAKETIAVNIGCDNDIPQGPNCLETEEFPVSYTGFELNLANRTPQGCEYTGLVKFAIEDRNTCNDEEWIANQFGTTSLRVLGYSGDQIISQGIEGAGSNVTESGISYCTFKITVVIKTT